MTEYPDLAYSLAGVRRSNPFDRRRQHAYGMIKQGADTSPVQHPLQGAARLAQALVGGWMANRADTDEQASVEKQNATLTAAMAEPDPQKRIALLSAANPELGARLSGQLAVEQAKIAQQQAGLQGGGQQLAAGFGMPSGGPQQASMPPTGGYQGTLGGHESSNNPQAVNPQSGAHGLFQFLPPAAAAVRAARPDLNLPEDHRQWTPEQQKQAEETLRSLNAQGLQKNGLPVNPVTLYLGHRVGVEGTKAILSVPPNTPMAQVVPAQWVQQNPDMRGTVGQFVGQAQQRFGGQQQVAQAGGPPVVPQGSNPQAAPGMPPAPSPQGINAPTVSAPPAIPDAPYPQPTPELLAKHEQLLKSGAYGRDINSALPAARAAIKAELDQQWQVQRERSKMEYEQRFGEYKDTRKRDAEAPQKLFDNAAKLRDDFTKEPVVKSYRVVVPMLESAKDAATRPTRAADINLVYAFAKLMDPDSVVRESETGMVQASATVQDRLAGLIGHLNGNPMLQPDTRQKLLAELQSRFNSLATSYQEIEGAYGGIADSAGIKREHVILPIRKPGQGPQISEPAPAKGGGQPGPGALPKLGANGEGYDTLKPGQQYIAPDGSTRTKGGG